jgi:hypothetical protein
MADELAFRAGGLSRLAYRSGGRKFVIPDGAGWREIARALRDSDQNLAITGAIAATRYTSIASAVWPVFYVEDVDAACAAANLAPAENGPGVTLIPFDEVTVNGVETTSDGARWAAPWQVVLDCYGGTGRMPDQAEAMVSVLTAQAA